MAAGGPLARPRRRVLLRADLRRPRAARLRPGPRRLRGHPGRAPGRAAVLPLRAGDVRLLAGLGPRAPHDARRPLRSRRDVVEGLPAPEHRPQGHRDPVHRQQLLLPARGRADGDAHARGARAARAPVRRRQRLQRPLQRPRVAADLPLHHPGLRRHRELRAAAHDRRAGHGLPAAERAVVLAAPDRRRDDAAVVPGPGRLVRHGLDGLRPALHRGAHRAGLLHDRRCSSRARPPSRRR